MVFSVLSLICLIHHIFGSPIAESPPFPKPLYPYEYKDAVLREDFKSYMTYSYVTNCKSIWTKQEYPQGNVFEKQFPSTLVKGFYDSKSTLTAFIVYNEYLKSIIISFRPSVTQTLWKYDFEIWKSKFSSSEFDNGNNLKSFGFGERQLDHLGEQDGLHSEPAFLKSGINDTTSTKSSKPISIPFGIAVHRGFKVLYLTFRQEILALTMQLAHKFPTYKVVYTGHSLGASIAEIAAVDFAVNGNAPDRLWLFPFASPRTGNRRWATFVGNLDFAIKGRIQRLTKYRDPFTTLPFRFMNFEHVGQEHIIWDDNSISKCPQNPTGSMECLIGHPNLLFCNASLHAPRYYMNFLDLSFNCSAPPNFGLNPINRKLVQDVKMQAAF